MGSLEQLIRTYIPLPSTATGTGWYTVLCKVCNDHGKKGPRAGFKFDDNAVAYHCFNCGHSVSFNPSTDKRLPKKLIAVFRAFNIPDEQWQQYSLKLLGRETKQQTQQIPSKAEPKEIPLPKHFVPLLESTNVWATVGKEYLLSRQINPESYPFYIAEKTGKQYLDLWTKRLIIPIYKDNKLIFYTGRDLTDKAIKKYYSPSVVRENVLFGFDKLFVDTKQPLYIVEGWFDAFVIDGVAIFGNKLTKSQIYWLKSSPREKVYIPDRLGNGQGAATQALQQQWSISTPDIGNCKDINEAVVHYGKLYVLKQIVDNIATDFQGQLKISMYCDYDGDNKDSKSTRKGS